MADQNDTVHSEPIEYRVQHRRLIRGRASVAASALTPAEAGPVKQNDAVTGGEALTERQTHVLEIAAGTMEENNRRPIDYSGAIAQFDDVLTQATDLEEAPAWWVRPLDQLRADESDGGAAAKERSDNGESVHSSSACRADYRDQSSDSAQR
jgi:hypothetical protein